MEIKIKNKKVKNTIVFVVLIFIGFWGIKVLYEQVNDLQIKKQETESLLKEEQDILAELEMINKNEESNELAIVAENIPDGDQMPVFIEQISDLSSSYGVVLLSMVPMEEILEEGRIKKKEIKVTLTGEKENFNSFIKALEELARFTSISSITINPGRESGFSSFVVDLSIYYL